ncbi:hypothetical protein Dimus_035814 [Dionaea muscipula]
MDLTYMDHLLSMRLVNLPRVIMRHMSYVISMKDHELPYEDWLTMVFEAFGVSLVDKKGEEPKIYDYFEETFLTMCKSISENGVRWIGIGENKRRDDEVKLLEGESGSGEKFYDAEDEVQESPEVNEEDPAVIAQDSAHSKVTEASRSRPLAPSGHIP